jgi:hypothetical protein
MVRCDARDRKGRDPCVGAMGTFVVHLFDRDGNECGNTQQRVADKGKKTAKEDSDGSWRRPTRAGWGNNVQIKYSV